MSRSENPDQLAATFLNGNNAEYIEDLQARYEADPASVDAEWRDFFGALQEVPADVERNARGASWARPNWPVAANGDLVSALDGNWAETEKAVSKSIQA